jgi:hypothetical protein
MEAESQAVLNSLTEHNIQDAFKKWQKRLERCILADGDCKGGLWWSVGPKLVFDRMAAPVLEIMDWFLFQLATGIKRTE